MVLKVIHPVYGLIDLNQDLVLKNLSWKSLDIVYQLLFFPLTYPIEANQTEINSISLMSLNNTNLFNILKKYNIEYAIIIQNGQTGIFFKELYQRGIFIFETNNFKIVDLKFLL